MFFPKLILLAAVLAATMAIVLLQHRSLARQQESNSRLQLAITSIGNQISALEKSRPEKIQTEANSSRPAAPQVRHSSTPPAPAGSPTGDSAGREAIPYITLSKADLRHLKLAPVTEDFRLTEEVCRVLGMSQNERAAVDQAIAKLITTQQQMDISRLEKVENHLTTEDGLKTTFRISAYAQEGRKLADELIGQVTAALGQERTELLLGYADLDSLSAVGYEPFGRTEKTITFLDRENPDGTRGDCRIVMKIVDTVSGLSLSTSFANRDDSIPKPWRHLIQNVAPNSK